jgi:hypothetical protein
MAARLFVTSDVLIVPVLPAFYALLTVVEFAFGSV